MNSSQRLQLQNMIQANNTEDNTAFIRELKHSELIRSEVHHLITLRAEHALRPTHMTDSEFMTYCATECNFLFTYYTDIFNKVRKDELDISLLDRFLHILADIENGKYNQHEASFEVGTILKQMYVDSALRKADKLDQQFNAEKKEGAKEVDEEKANMTYLEFKQMYK